MSARQRGISLKLGVTALIVVLLAGCRDGADSYLLGASGPFKEGYGVMTQRGIDLAIEEINRAGGINGSAVKVLRRDDEANGARAAMIANEFVMNPAVLAVVGHVNSGAMLAASRVYDGQLTAIATTASSPDLTGISPWVFRVISSDSLNGVILARFASRVGGEAVALRRASILYENDTYGRGLADAFRRAFRGTIVSFDPISEKISDAEPFVSYLKLKQPGIVFVAGREASALRILREARRQQFEAIFIGGDGWQGIITDTAAAEGAFVGTSFNAEDQSPAVARFVRAFENKYHAKPDAFAALAYDATRLAVQAIRKSGRSRSGIRAYLASLDATNAFDGVTGPVYFNRGDPIGMGFRVAQIVSGALTTGGGRVSQIGPPLAEEDAR